jgi:hypothetical protein
MKKTKKAQFGALMRAAGKATAKTASKATKAVAREASNIVSKPKATTFAEWNKQNLPKNINKLSSNEQNKIRSKNPFRNPEAKGPNRRPELAYSGGWSLDDAFAGARDDFKSAVSERTRTATKNPNRSADIKRQIKKDYKKGGAVKAKSGKMISKRSSISSRKKR